MSTSSALSAHENIITALNVSARNKKDFVWFRLRFSDIKRILSVEQLNWISFSVDIH